MLTLLSVMSAYFHLMLRCVLVWSVVSHGNGYFSECCFPQESWAACAAEVSPQVRSFCLPVLSIAGGSPMWNSGGCSFLSCGFLHNEGRPGALTSLLAPAPASSCCPSNNIFPFKPSYIFYTLFWFMQNFSVCNMRRKSILRPPHC